MDNDISQFQTLLQSLLNSDNDVRTQAEASYDSIPDSTKVPFLLRSMSEKSLNLESRTMAAVLLRRLFTNNFTDLWTKLPHEGQVQVRKQLLSAVQEESEKAMRHKLCECTAEFARNMIDEQNNNSWPDILEFMFAAANSSDANIKESALHIFSIVPGIFGNVQNQNLDMIKQMLQHCMLDQSNATARFTAVKATGAFILHNEKDQDILTSFRDLVPAVLQGVEESIIGMEDDSLLKNLIDLADSCPKVLRPHIDRILSSCIKVVSNTEAGDSWRQLALEVIITLSESAPAMMRKFGGKYMPSLVPMILLMMTEIEDEDDWSVQDKDDEEEGDSNTIAAESSLDRLACALGGKTVLPQLTNALPSMLQSTDWKQRHAALMALSACGEGCHKTMENMLDGILDAVLPYLQDPHPRVRYSACNAIGQMSTDFATGLQKRYHAKVVPSLLMVLDDTANPRVQAHAAAALVNFSEDCPKSILAAYLDHIMAKLETVLNSRFKDLLERGHKLVLEQVVTTIAAVADTAEDKFIKYYDRLLPNLLYIVENGTDEKLKTLRGKTIECISLIGLAVGKKKFLPDCERVMQLLMKTQTEIQDSQDDDPQVSYMISAWARMCKIMGKEFQKYLPLVMGPVLRAAQIKPEVAVVDNYCEKAGISKKVDPNMKVSDEKLMHKISERLISEDQKYLEEDQDWQFVTLSDQQSFGIRTSGLEDKATACTMLVCYARELKEAFAPYAEEVVKMMVPHLRFYFHDGVRCAAAESLPYLLECAKINGAEYLNSMWQYILTPLLQAIDTEPEIDIRAEHYYAMSQCVELVGRGCFTEEQLKELLRIYEKGLKRHFEKQDERQRQRKEEDYDEDVEETLQDEDEEDVYLLSKMSDVIHSMFASHKEVFLPAFQQLLPYFVQLIGQERPWADRQWGLCIFDDLLEHTPSAMSSHYAQYFLQPMLHYLTDKQAEVRQAASFGIGVAAIHEGQEYLPAIREALPKLIQMIQHPMSRQHENISATENAVSAVAKILKHKSHSIENNSELLNHWLSWLPVWEDEEEAKYCYDFLCDLIESNHVGVLGPDNCNIPRLLAIMADAFYKDAVEEESLTGQRMVMIIKQIKGNPQIFNACLSQLTHKQQDTIADVLEESGEKQD